MTETLWSGPRWLMPKQRNPEVIHTLSDQLDHECQAVHMAVAGFITLAIEARTAEECTQIHRAIETVLASLDAASRSALDRADSYRARWIMPKKDASGE